VTCIICDQPAKRPLNISFNRVGPDGERHAVRGRLYVCAEHLGLVMSMPLAELELFMASNAPPASTVTEESKSMNGNGPQAPDPAQSAA
jgi:hypothetical protein